MRILVIINAPPRADENTMGIQQTFHRIRLLKDEHQFTVAYSNRQRDPEPDPSATIPFRLLRLPSPPAPVPLAYEDRPRRYWWFNGWRHALFDLKPQVFKETNQPLLRAALAELIRHEHADVIHVIGESMLNQLPKHAPRVLADLPDLYSNLFRGLAAQRTRRRTHQFQSALEIKKLERIESKMLRAARGMLFVSELDRAVARRLAPATPSYIVPNSTNLEYFHPNGRLEEPATLLFTGTLSYTPNVEAAQYFVKEILPRVRAAVPEVRLEIVGYNPTPDVCALANAHVRVVGSVPDVRPFFERATICIVPLKNGSGTRIKIIEAWAMKKAVVSTSIGAEGLHARHMQNLWIADSPADFANAILALIAQPELRVTLGENGRRLVERQYSLTNAVQQLNSIYYSMSNA